MNRWFVIIALIAGLSVAATGEGTDSPLEVALRSDGDLPFAVDVYQFRGEGGRTAIELAYAVPMSGADETRLAIGWRLSGGDGTELNAGSESRQFGASGEGEGQTFIDLKRFEVQRVDTLSIVLTIGDGDREGRVAARLAVRDFSEGLSLSSPVFLSGVRRSEAASVFQRHGVEMIPDPFRRVDTRGGRDNLLAYFEIDNLPHDSASTGSYALNAAVTDLQGNVVAERDHPTLAISSANTARLEKVDLSGLTSGLYRLAVSVSEHREGRRAEITRLFQVVADSGSALVLAMDEASIEQYYDQIRHIATREEKALFRELDPAGKQNFLLTFWRSRDPDPATPANEFMQEHFRRLQYCREHFGNLDDDRTRIMVMYGEPISIERKTNRLEYDRGVEIWTYGMEGGAEFVLVDRNRDEHYVLVHSTHPDELHNPDWEEEVTSRQ